MIRYNVEDIVRVESAPCPCGETTRRGFFEGRTKDIVSVAGQAILPIDVARALPVGTEFVIVRATGPADTLHVQIEGRIDDAVDRISASTDTPVEVEWRSEGALPRASYKAQRVVDSAV
jgi:phenylacetate-CoA ligase